MPALWSWNSPRPFSCPCKRTPETSGRSKSRVARRCAGLSGRPCRSPGRAPTSVPVSLLISEHRKKVFGTVPRVRICSATQSKVQRNPPGLLWKLQEMGAISKILLVNRTGENVLLNAEGKLCGFFLRRAPEQSGFNDSVRRTQCDHKSMVW